MARARHEVVHERRGEQLTIVAVDHLLAENLPHALRHPAMDLPLHDCPVQQVSDVIDCSVGHNGDDPGFRIDLDFADVASVRKAHLRGHKLCDAIEPARQVLWRCGQPQAGRKIENRNHTVRPCNPKCTVAEIDIVNICLEKFRCTSSTFFDCLVAGNRRGAARHHDRTRCNTRRTWWYFVAIALNESHGLVIDSELLRYQRHECRKMSLSHCLNAGAQGYLAVLLEPQVDGFVENTAGYFEKAADTDATQFSVPLRGLAACRKTTPVRERLRLFEHLLEEHTS